MSLQNVATVLGPNILRQPTDSAALMVHHAGSINSCALELVKNPAIHESMSDFYASLNTTQETVRPRKFVCFAQALYGYMPSSIAEPNIDESEIIGDGLVTQEIDFAAGDILGVRSMSQDITQHSFGDPACSPSEANWWVVERIGHGADRRPLGIVPSNYIQVVAYITPSDDHFDLDQFEQLPALSSFDIQSPEIRAVLEEVPESPADTLTIPPNGDKHLVSPQSEPQPMHVTTLKQRSSSVAAEEHSRPPSLVVASPPLLSPISPVEFLHPPTLSTQRQDVETQTDFV
jgi:hypothetical protein